MFDKGSPIKLASLLPILVLNSKGSSWKAHYVAEKIFFWGWDSDTWKLLKVPWNLITRPKSKDGVDMGLILSKNKALSFKWIWHLSGSKSSGWKNFICHRYKPLFQNGLPHFSGSLSKYLKGICFSFNGLNQQPLAVKKY